MTKAENLLAAIRVLARYLNNPTGDNMSLCCDPVDVCLRDAIPYYHDIGIDPPYCDICRRNYQGHCIYGKHAYKSKDAMLPFRNGCSRAIMQWCVDRLLVLLECDLDRFDLVFNMPNNWTLAEFHAFKEKEGLPGKPFPNNQKGALKYD